MGHCGEPNCFADSWDLKLGVVLAFAGTVYIHTLFFIHCPFKGYGKLLKTAF
jgi:hypothetical protein